MTSIRSAAWMAACIALWAAPPAEACEFTWGPAGMSAHDCNLKEFFGGKFDEKLDHDPVPVAHNLLPNLTIDDVDVVVVNGAATASFVVGNRGNNKASNFDTTLMLSVIDPVAARVAIPVTPFGPFRITTLPAGASIPAGGGALQLPSLNQDWDVCVLAKVDPSPLGGPAYGRVVELNEADNASYGCCRVYGPKPNVVGPPSCFSY